MRFPVKAYTAQQLRDKSTPASLPGGSLEAFRFTWFDRQQVYPAAGGISTLEYFTSTATNKALSNMEAAGQFADPKYFRIMDIMIHPEVAPSATAWADFHEALIDSGAWVSLKISDKEYFRTPISHFRQPGGLEGFAATQADASATGEQYANLGPKGYGYWQDGSILIPPKINFTVQIHFDSTTAGAIAADMRIGVHLDGVVYRRIL